MRSPGQFANQNLPCRVSPASRGVTQCHCPQTTCFEAAFKGTGRSVPPGRAHGHPFSRRETCNSWSGYRRATKMLKGLNHLFYKERLREQRPVSLETRRLTGDGIDMYKYLNRRCQERGAKSRWRQAMTQEATSRN